MSATDHELCERAVLTSEADLVEMMAGQYAPAITNDLPVDTPVIVMPHGGPSYRGVVSGHTSVAYLVQSVDDPDDVGVVAVECVEVAR